MTRKATILYLLRLAQVMLSVVSLSLVAKYFGVTLDRDMWLIALNCIVVIDLAMWGPINQTFRAKFVLLKENEGESAILDKTRSLLLLIFLVSSVAVVSILLFSSPIARLLAPTYSGDQLHALSRMLMCIAPSLLFNQFCQIGVSILNAYESFFIPEISQLLTTGFNILCLVYLAPKVGIYALLVSYYIGLVILSVMLVIQLLKRGVPIFGRFRRIRFWDAKPFLWYALPFFFPFFLIQLNLLMEKSLGNLLGDGVVSIIDYSRKFVDMPMNVLSSVLLTMLVPVLSLRFARGDRLGFFEEFRKIYQLGLLVIALLIALFMSSSEELISVLLFYGDYMDRDVIAYIGDLSRYYACTTLVNFFYTAFGVVLLSTDRGRVYAVLGVIVQLIMISINVIWFRDAGPYVFPISFLIAHAVAALVLFFYFPGSKRRLVFLTAKYLLVVAIVAGIAWAINEWIVQNRFSHFLTLVVNSFTIIFTLLMIVVVFRLEEYAYIVRVWKNLPRLLRIKPINDR